MRLNLREVLEVGDRTRKVGAKVELSLDHRLTEGSQVAPDLPAASTT